MFCNQCGNALAEGTAFCPYCGNNVSAQASPSAAEPVQQAYAQQPYQQAPYQQPQQPQYQPYGQQNVYENVNPAYNQGYFVPQQRADDNAVNSTKTLGLVALIVGLFIPLVGIICGSIGLSKARKLMFYADPMQQEQLKKSKTLCTLGIVIPIAISVLANIILIISNS